MSSPVAHADAPTAYVRNLWPGLGNKNLDFCSDSGTTGCIESLVIDDVEVNQTDDRATADYEIAGGVYGKFCRFVETVATNCETPYFHIYPTTATPMNTVRIEFRRQMNDEATSTIGAVLVSGEVQSFIPASPDLGDTAVLEIDTMDIENVYPKWVLDQFAVCFGYFTLISTCPMPSTSQVRTTNRISVLMMPSQPSPAVPADVGPSCSGPEDPSGCFVLVFERSSIGSWMDTDAAFYGGTESSRGSNAIDFRVSGPHFQTDGTTPNLASFRSFIPDAFLATAFGLTAAASNETTMPIRKISSGVESVPVVDYSVDEGGLLVTVSEISFSSPVIRTSRVLEVSVGSSVADSSIISAAGLSSVQRFQRSTVTANTRSNPPGGVRKVRSVYRFTKAGTYSFSVRYKSAARSRSSTRTITVNVTP